MILRPFHVLAILLLVLLPLGASGQEEPPPSGPLFNCAGPAVEQLAWMAGYWTDVTRGVASEELWLPPAGGVMLGLHRDVGPDGPASFEYLRIETGDDGRPVYLASLLGRPPVPFPLKQAVRGRVEFVNPEHDFPRRITYRLEGPDRLCARADDGNDEGEGAREWCWKRSGDPFSGLDHGEGS